jgi:hypothetical protein
MPNQSQTTFLTRSERPSVVALPPAVREELRTLVARLLMQTIRQQQSEEENDEKRK